MEKCTDTVVDWMIRCNVINEADKELYKYALHSLILLVSPLILAGGIGFGLGSVKHGVALIFPFMVLRKFSGGYHAKKLHTCIMGSGFLLFLCIMLSTHMQCDWKLAIATGIASVSLIVFSPIDNENRRLDTDEKRTYKKITVFCVIFFGLLDIVLFLLGKYIYTICFSVGILLTAGLQAPYIVKKMHKLTKNGRKMSFDVKRVEIMAKIKIMRVVIGFTKKEKRKRGNNHVKKEISSGNSSSNGSNHVILSTGNGKEKFLFI